MRGTRTRVSSGNNQGAPIPGKHTRVPRMEGVECGRKWEWEMTHQDYPLLWQGDIYVTAPSPKPTNPLPPTTQLKQEAGEEAFVTQIT